MEAWTDKTNAELFRLYGENHSEAIRRELTARYLYMPRSIAKKYYPAYAFSMELEDAVNEGVLALMRGIDTYDPDKNVEFSTYIFPRIAGAMLDRLREQEWIPKGYRKKNAQIEAARQELTARQGRPPTREELAAHVGMTVKACERVTATCAAGNVQSLDALMQDERTAQVAQTPSANTDAQPETAFLQKEQRRLLLEAVRGLDEREKTVLSLYYKEGLKSKQIAQVLGVSQPRVAQIHQSTLRKLRARLEEE